MILGKIVKTTKELKVNKEICECKIPVSTAVHNKCVSCYKTLRSHVNEPKYTESEVKTLIESVILHGMDGAIKVAKHSDFLKYPPEITSLNYEQVAENIVHMLDKKNLLVLGK